MEEILNSFSGLIGVLGGFLGLAAFVLLIAILKAIIKVAPPDTVMVVAGRKTKCDGRNFGFSVEKGRTAVVPYFQSMDTLNLGVFPISVRVEGVNSANGITVGADATACVCIDDEEKSMLYSAVERLMGKDAQQIHDQVQQTLVGNFRGALNKATPLQAIGMDDSIEGGESVGERAQFRAELLNDINSDLRSFGMKVVSVSFQKIWDGSNYIANLAQQTLAEKRRQVEIEESRLHALAEQAESDCVRRIEVAKSMADEAIIAARQDLELFRRESSGRIEEARLTADQSIAQATNQGEAAVQAEQIKLRTLQNKSTVTLDAEAKEEAARILAEGQRESIGIREGARNEILKAKAELLSKFGDDASSVLFLQQKLPELYQAYLEQVGESEIEQLVVMDQEQGFSSAVNRGARAFSDFLKTFADTFGIDIKKLSMPAAMEGGAK
jgi:flotillin